MFIDINRITHSLIVGIQDNADSPGIFLIKELITTETNPIDVFCYDKFHYVLKSELNVNLDRVSFHDCSPTIPTDLLSVNNSDYCLESDYFEQFLNSMKKTKPAKKTIIVIDSLSTMLLIHPFEKVYRILQGLLIDHNLKGQRIQVYAIIHEDTVLDPYQTLKILRHRLCRVWAQVKSDHIVLSNRTRSGKVSTTIYDYTINDRGFVCIVKRKSIRKNEEKTDTILSTFKLTLSESEKKAREAVVLPYEKDESDKNSTKGGNIYYQQDEYDDWDEEDPDNDLEFG